MLPADAGWKEVWDEIGKPFLAITLLAYFLLFVVFEITSYLLP